MPMTASRTLKNPHEMPKMNTKHVTVPITCATSWLPPP